MHGRLVLLCLKRDDKLKILIKLFITWMNYLFHLVMGMDTSQWRAWHNFLEKCILCIMPLNSYLKCYYDIIYLLLHIIFWLIIFHLLILIFIYYCHRRIIPYSLLFIFIWKKTQFSDQWSVIHKKLWSYLSSVEKLCSFDAPDVSLEINFQTFGPSHRLQSDY